MSRQCAFFMFPAMIAVGLLVSGCGKGSQTPESTTVIMPAEKPQPEETSPALESAAPTESAPKAEEATPDVAVTETVAESPADARPIEVEVAEDVTSVTETPPAAAPAEPVAEETEVVSETVTVAYRPASVDLGAEPGGTMFKGRVVVKGSAIQPKPIEPNKDAFCIALGHIKDESLVVGPDGGLANVIVWLRKAPAGAKIPPPPQEPFVLDNIKCSFFPHAAVLRVGQTMLVKNEDPTAHNTRISPIRNPAFNQTIAPNERKGIEVVYKQPELVPIKTQCDIHPWMGSFHFPVEHPWAAVSDENGNFEITGLPAGDLEFRLWHERMGYVEKSVTFKFADGETVERTFEVDALKLVE
ncbi:MAG: hypothetical protein KF861_21200 [Planctomycetaceae bacterium]|nr:hypothetical protein [Planctomycetaceae bacterium]